MNKGDLVWVTWTDSGMFFSPISYSLRPAIVLDYRPDVVGGTTMYSSRWEGSQHTHIELATTERRGEVLIQLLDGEGVTWIDEAKLQRVTSGAQGA